MRNLFAIASLTLMCACTPGTKSGTTDTVDNTATPTDSALINRLLSFQQAGTCAVGHHDDPAYGHSWKYMPDSSDVKSVTGSYPAIFDWDLGLIEWGCDSQLDGVPFDFIREQAVAHHNAGGINSFSWHVRNPKGGDAWNVKDPDVRDAVAASLQPGELNDTLRLWMGRTADFINSLTDADGSKIPVIFRPWHEHTGSWFWWGEDLCSPDDYKALWHLTREVFDSKGVDNVVWAYSTGTEPSTADEYLERYPGDDYIDILGFDTYYFGDASVKDAFRQRLASMLDITTAIAAERGKVAAVAEVGYEGIPIDNWFTDVLAPVVAEYPVAYMVFWRNAWDKPSHYYVPYPGHPAAADFAAFRNLPTTLFLDDITTDK